MAQAQSKDHLKEIYEWRYKTTLADTYHTQKRIPIKKFSALSSLILIAYGLSVWVLFTAWTRLSFIALGTLMTAVILYRLSHPKLPPELFVCREGLGLLTHQTFKTIPFQAINTAEITDHSIHIESLDTTIHLRKEDYDPVAIEGIIAILKAEGFGGTKYPYHLYFTPKKIVLEENPDVENLSTHERFKKMYRYYEEVSWEDIEIVGAKMRSLKRLKDRTAAITFKSIKALTGHPANPALTDQKTDEAIVVFNAFEVIHLKKGDTVIEKPFTTLKDVIKDTTVQAIHRSPDGSWQLAFTSLQGTYVLTFTSTLLHTGFNALEEDAWYHI